MNRSYVALVAVWIAILTIAATGRNVWAAEENQEAQVEVFFKRLAVAPVFVGHRIPSMDETLDDTLICKISDICVDDPNINANAGAMLTRLIRSALFHRFGDTVVPMDEAQKAFDSLHIDKARDTPRTVSKRLGQLLSADLVVVGTVWRYRDRGSMEGVPDIPSAVAFALYLVEPQTGRRIWRKIFDEAQAYAYQDVSKFKDRIKMGMQWLTADQLARYGVKKALSGFPSYVIPLSSVPAGGATDP